MSEDYAKTAGHAPALQLATSETTTVRYQTPGAQASPHERTIGYLRSALEEEREEHRRTILELQNMRRALRRMEAKLGTAYERGHGLTH